MVRRLPQTKSFPAISPSSQVSFSCAVSFSSSAAWGMTRMREAKIFSPSANRKPPARGSTMFRSMRRVHMRVSARSHGVLPIRVLPAGPTSSRYSQMAVISARTWPSSSSRAGIWPDGFLAM